LGVIGPAEIEDILLDLSETFPRTKNNSLERMPVWPVPARTVFGARARNEARSVTASRSHDASGADEHFSGSDARG
jgi:hypothetical protein